MTLLVKARANRRHALETIAQRERNIFAGGDAPCAPRPAVFRSKRGA